MSLALALLEFKTTKSHSLLAADIIANAPDPVFVSDLAGRILQANDAVSHLLGFRQDELIRGVVSRIRTIPDATRE
ncbi:MAG: PAS domain-containing protein [Acidobacteriota bacterium]